MVRGAVASLVVSVSPLVWLLRPSRRLVAGLEGDAFLLSVSVRQKKGGQCVETRAWREHDESNARAW